MTLPASGTLTFAQIQAEFGRGYNMNAYRGTQWWQDNTLTGTFPSSNLAFSNFYSKRSTTPVTPGTAYYRTSTNYQSPFNSSGVFTVPLYSLLTVTVRGGGGGGGGGDSNASPDPTSGTAGGSTTFGSPGNSYYLAATGGGGGPGGSTASGSLGGPSNDGTPAGGGGGKSGYVGYSAGGPGGAGGYNQTTFTNPISGGSGPTVSSTVGTSIGGGGTAGSGGGGLVYTGIAPIYYAYANGGDGDAGTAGYVTVSWS